MNLSSIVNFTEMFNSTTWLHATRNVNFHGITIQVICKIYISQNE